MLRVVLFIVVSIFLYNGLFAQTKIQNVINSSGGSTTINGEIYQWSIGETYMNMDIANGIIVSSGFLQPKSDLDKEHITEEELNIYPNPVYGNLNVVTKFTSEGQLKYRLFSADGKLVLNSDRHIIPNENLKIDLSQISAGVYFMEFTYHRKDKKKWRSTTYKIQKLN